MPSTRGEGVRGREYEAPVRADYGRDAVRECSERLTAFGGLLALVKFLDLLQFEVAFAQHYVLPTRVPQLGDHRMMLGLLLLLFIGFQRLGHFA